jgi:hypothetical protein
MMTLCRTCFLIVVRNALVQVVKVYRHLAPGKLDQMIERGSNMSWKQVSKNLLTSLDYVVYIAPNKPQIDI